MLTNAGEIVRHANAGNFAVPAINVFSTLDARAVLEAAEELVDMGLFGVAVRTDG